MTYVDGFVIVIPKKNIQKYVKLAKTASKVWKKHGALAYYECMGEDINPDMKGIKTSSFPKMTKLKKNETVWFSFIIYKSKAHRNQVNAKVMKDPDLNPEDCQEMMPFDMKKFAYAGFKTMVQK